MTFSAAQTGAKAGIGERYLPKIVGLAAKIETSKEVSPHDFRVAPGGDAFRVFVLSAADESMTVLYERAFRIPIGTHGRIPCAHPNLAPPSCEGIAAGMLLWYHTMPKGELYT